jgi:hypothetical protein
MAKYNILESYVYFSSSLYKDYYIYIYIYIGTSLSFSILVVEAALNMFLIHSTADWVKQKEN